jgi:predicted dehydrogenase
MTFKVVVVGTGFGDQLVAPAFRDAGCEVAIVSPRDAAAVRAAIEGPCDIVSVHSPPFMHLEHVRLAAEAGRHVLCDKPFGRNAAEAGEMLRLAEQAGVRHFLNFEFRSDLLRLKLQSLLDEGAIGAPAHVSWVMHTARGRDRRHGWLFEAETGGGWIGAFGSHAIDALRWLFGEVAEVQCRTRTEVGERRERGGDRMMACTAEDAFTAWFHMDSGVTAALDTAFAASVDIPDQISVFGDAGVLQARGGRELSLLRRGREPERHVFREGETDPHLPAMRFWAAKVCQAVAERRQIAPSFKEGVACAEVMDRLRVAAKAA